MYIYIYKYVFKIYYYFVFSPIDLQIDFLIGYLCQNGYVNPWGACRHARANMFEPHTLSVCAKHVEPT